MLAFLAAAPLLATALALPHAPSSSAGLVLAPLEQRTAIHALAASPCASYHGIVGSSSRRAIFYARAGCSTDTAGEGASRVPFDWTAGAGELMWAGATEVDPTVEELVDRQSVLRSSFGQAWLAGQPALRAGSEQLAFGRAGVQSGPALIAELDSTQQLWYFDSDEGLSLWTAHPSTALSQLVALSRTPLPVPAAFLAPTAATANTPITINGGETVPKADVARIVGHLKELAFQPLISLLLTKVPADDIEADVRFLSGEAQPGLKKDEGWVSRHSMSEGGHRASDWLLSRFRGYGFACEQHQYKLGFAPMIECVLEGVTHPDEYVVIGAHFDSRGSFGYPAAPGADDDGSGTSIILALAREISRNSLSFDRTLVIAAFSGEEQGLLGSKWYSQQLKDSAKDVVLMIQNDMLGYRKPGEPLQLAFPDLIGLDEAKWLVGNISTLYAPELVVGETPACCSDHQYFDQLGFASTWVFERNGPIADPMYHNSGDLSAREGYSFEQIHLAHSVIYATVLEVAGFNMAG